MPKLERRSRGVVEAEGGNPYCCWGCVDGVGIAGTSEEVEDPGSAVYKRPVDVIKGDNFASRVATPLALLILTARGDLGVKIRRLGNVPL